MIRDELSCSFPFTLKKCNIPLPRNMDHKKAGLMITNEKDFLMVVPDQGK